MKKILLTVATLLAVSTGAMAADFTPKTDNGFTRGNNCGYACGGHPR
ncbi:hypothetical protein KTI78_00675 [Acinetobacter sp. WU_MDCI_Abxe161]|jgi:hypothetical protein|nr:hypothetical protein [Acinetobacter sp. WU_MDCI_Abxe161]MCU4501676.1 hypothetical protein [Acinetobacter sp. WU_MDCI_Abxe161]